MLRDAAFLLLASVALACSVDTDSGPMGGTCTPGVSFACSCVDGSPGTAVCGPDGSPGVCMCGAATDGSATAASTGSAEGGSDDACASACADSSSASGSASTGDCPGTIYGGRVDSAMVPWSFDGQSGLDGGQAMCASIGADHVCEYGEVRMAELAGEFEGMVNLTAWVHRTTIESVDGVPSAPGPGGRCVDWTDATGMFADGEWVEFTADGLVYNLDPDTFYDGLDGSHTDPLGLPCAGISRALLCCNAAC